jgi:hypothetical protein
MDESSRWRGRRNGREREREREKRWHLSKRNLGNIGKLKNESDKLYHNLKYVYFSDVL